MAKMTFFSVFKNNLECAFCPYTACQVRYMPERKKSIFVGGKEKNIYCPKETEKRRGQSLGRKLP